MDYFHLRKVTLSNKCFVSNYQYLEHASSLYNKY